MKHSIYVPYLINCITFILYFTKHHQSVHIEAFFFAIGVNKCYYCLINKYFLAYSFWIIYNIKNEISVISFIFATHPCRVESSKKMHTDHLKVVFWNFPENEKDSFICRLQRMILFLALGYPTLITIMKNCNLWVILRAYWNILRMPCFIVKQSFF